MLSTTCLFLHLMKQHTTNSLDEDKIKNHPNLCLKMNKIRKDFLNVIVFNLHGVIFFSVTTFIIVIFFLYNKLVIPVILK